MTDPKALKRAVAPLKKFMKASERLNDRESDADTVVTTWGGVRLSFEDLRRLIDLADAA